MSEHNVKIILSLLFVIAVAALIFAFSAQDGEDSARLSGSVSEWLATHLIPGFARMAPAEQRALVLRVHHIIRKAAHFSEYALLALALVNFLRRALERRRPSFMALIAWIVATLYACTDEFHQMFVASRGPAVKDVCIDSAGALVGVLIGMLLIVLSLRSKARLK